MMAKHMSPNFFCKEKTPECIVVVNNAVTAEAILRAKILY